MSDCSRYELAIDRRLGNALPDAEARALTAHLATCEACTAYEQDARSLQGDLRSRASDARDAVDWGRVERSIRQRLLARMQKLGVGIGLGILAVALTAWGLAPAGDHESHPFLIAVVVGAIVLARVLFVVREVQQVARLERGEELLAQHRRMLERQVRSIRRFRWVAGAVVIGLVLSALRTLTLPHLVAHAGLVCIVAGTWLHTLLVTYPRLGRELRELAPEGRA